MRPEGDVESAVKKLQARAKTTEMLATYRACLTVQEVSLIIQTNYFDIGL